MPCYELTVLVSLTILHVEAKLPRYDNLRQLDRLSDHTLVTESNVFPYVAAVLKKQSYLSAGALLDDRWVLTAANSLFQVRESSRIIRIRLGSINYKKGGVLLPVKNIEVHPYFDDTKPLYDIALIRLADRVWLTPTLYPIRLQTRRKDVTATHFIVTAWTPSIKLAGKPTHMSIDSIKQRRILSVSHLHPADPEHCYEELAVLDVNDTGSVMCLDSDLKSDPCWRDTGAPVVLNGVLWGVISSWRADDCYAQPSSSFVTLTAAPGVRGWLRATTRERKWNSTERDATDEFADIDSRSQDTNEI